MLHSIVELTAGRQAEPPGALSGSIRAAQRLLKNGMFNGINSKYSTGGRVALLSITQYQRMGQQNVQ
jgi:hypothetical protein